jgi:hypothetical protein
MDRDCRVSAALLETAGACCLWRASTQGRGACVERILDGGRRGSRQAKPSPSSSLIDLVRSALGRTGRRLLERHRSEKLEMYRALGAEFDLRDIHEIPPRHATVTLATASFLQRSVAGWSAWAWRQAVRRLWGLMRLLDGMRARRPPLVLLEMSRFLTSHGGRDFERAWPS